MGTHRPEDTGGDYGLLKNGTYQESDFYPGGTRPKLEAASADTYIELNFNDSGYWGRFKNGAFSGGDSSSTFGSWDMLGATGNSVMLYSLVGTAAYGTLVGGNYAYGHVGNAPAGLTIIAGGK